MKSARVKLNRNKTAVSKSIVIYMVAALYDFVTEISTDINEMDMVMKFVKPT